MLKIRLASPFIGALAALVLFSCGQQKKEHSVQISDTTLADTLEEAGTDLAALSFLSEENASRELVRLCNAVLTSREAMESAFPDYTDDFFKETTPEKDVFYFPDSDIGGRDLVRTVQLRYNYVALFNRVIHSYEWFQRMSTGIDEEESPTTRKDTLEWIRSVRPKISESVIKAAFPDAEVQSLAKRLLRAYDHFDGNDREDSPFSTAMAQYTESLSQLPELVNKEDIERFDKQFWDWYDKKNIVPEIDTLIRMNMHNYKGTMPTDEQLENLRRSIEAEQDIDRRTVLALEYVKYDRWDGLPLLGEILESRIYTKYLLEAWISWRAHTQLYHSPSSFGIIANNYYDKLRSICVDTMVRHCIQTDDKNTECLIENLIFCEIIHRMGSFAGNSSMNICAMLAFNMFIHPRLLPGNSSFNTLGMLLNNMFIHPRLLPQEEE